MFLHWLLAWTMSAGVGASTPVPENVHVDAVVTECYGASPGEPVAPRSPEHR